jgi:hypothetical protein
MATPASNYVMAFNGFLFGGPGQGVQVLEIDGLESLPDLRTQDDIRGYQDGMFTGRDFLSGRYVTFRLQIMNDSANTMQTYLAQLKSNLVPQQQGTGVLQFQLPGRSLQRLNARVRKRNIKLDPEYVYGRSEAMVEFFCADPRIYDDALITAALNPTSQVGRVYNRVYPLLYNTIGSGGVGSTTVTNSGNVTVFPTFTLNGAMTNPIIVNSSTGQYLSLNITTSATDTIVIDPDLRSITYNGLPARNLLINGSSWFGLPAGSTTIGIISSTASTASSLVITYRNGYI